MENENILPEDNEDLCEHGFFNDDCVECLAVNVEAKIDTLLEEDANNSYQDSVLNK